MDDIKKSLRVCHLYPKLLNLYGDIGNIIALKQRCKWYDIDFELLEVDLGEEIPDADFYFIGGGQDKQQIDVSFELVKHKDFLISKRDENVVFLGICGGYQLLGEYYQPFESEKLVGLGLLNCYTVAGQKRFIGNVTVIADCVKPNTLVGFENHSGLTYIQNSTKPLAYVHVGNGNNGEDKTEGARYKNVFGTYMHGSFLPKNPHFADYLITLALENKYNEKIVLPKIDDTIEYKAHEVLIGKAY